MFGIFFCNFCGKLNRPLRMRRKLRTQLYKCDIGVVVVWVLQGRLVSRTTKAKWQDERADSRATRTLHSARHTRTLTRGPSRASCAQVAPLWLASEGLLGLVVVAIR